MADITDYESQNPRVALPKAVFLRAELAALRRSREQARRVTRREVVEAAIRAYLTQAAQARAAQQPMQAERVVIRSGSPTVRISAAVRAQLAAEARQQAIEQQQDVAIGQLATAAVTRYLDDHHVPFPKTSG
ncbi:MAG TPA: hypothetical protein VFZ66_17235 [Herpetosiphonaceae bacterium]